MEEIIFLNGKIEYRGFWFNVGISNDIEGICFVNLFDDNNNFNIILVPNETSINGVLQTSAQMIIDTLNA